MERGRTIKAVWRVHWRGRVAQTEIALDPDHQVNPPGLLCPNQPARLQKVRGRLLAAVPVGFVRAVNARGSTPVAHSRTQGFPCVSIRLMTQTSGFRIHPTHRITSRNQQTTSKPVGAIQSHVWFGPSETTGSGSGSGSANVCT